MQRTPRRPAAAGRRAAAVLLGAVWEIEYSYKGFAPDARRARREVIAYQRSALPSVPLGIAGLLGFIESYSISMTPNTPSIFMLFHRGK